MAKSSCCSCLNSMFLISSILFSSYLIWCEAEGNPAVVNGLSYSSYSESCPKLESIVIKHLRNVFKQAHWQAPALLVIFFHDCFVQGCDGSLLLDGNPGERDHPLNRGISSKAVQTIDELREVVHNLCGRIVSCADITVLAARDAVFLPGGPYFNVPLGRQDSLNFSIEETNNLPLPYNITDVTLKTFESKNLDVTDVVALSGAHYWSCPLSYILQQGFSSRSTMDKTLAKLLNSTCPTTYSHNTFRLDFRTPKTFDNKYYINLMNHQGLFTSDQDLFKDKRTKGLVEAFALNQTFFFHKFIHAFVKMSQLDVLTQNYAFVKMSQLDVLTQNQGEIRAKCNLINDERSMVKSIVDEIVQLPN